MGLKPSPPLLARRTVFGVILAALGGQSVQAQSNDGDVMRFWSQDLYKDLRRVALTIYVSGTITVPASAQLERRASELLREPLRTLSIDLIPYSQTETDALHISCMVRLRPWQLQTDDIDLVVGSVDSTLTRAAQEWHVTSVPELLAGRADDPHLWDIVSDAIAAYLDRSIIQPLISLVKP